MKRLTWIKLAVSLAVSISVALVIAVWPAGGYGKHLCGVYGTEIGPQESCPGISPPHKWRWVVGYRDENSGIDMCVVIRSRKNRYMFSRCSFYATQLYIRPQDLNLGRQRTRAYNKNNNVTLGRETRYLYADTKRRKRR